MSNCELCGEPMPEGETMFKYHGYSGKCPKPPLPRVAKPTYEELETALTAARAEAEALRKDAERLKFQYSQYVKTCEAVGLGGVVSYEQWISAIDAARSERGIV